MSANKNFAGKEIFQRMNYLYQISETTLKKAHENDTKTSKQCLEFISNYYSGLLVNIGKKAQLRIDSTIKRTICKGCQKLLIPGQTARVRIRKKPKHHARWTCLNCGSFRTFNNTKDYKIWTERPEALVQEKTDKNKKT